MVAHAQETVLDDQSHKLPYHIQSVSLLMQEGLRVSTTNCWSGHLGTCMQQSTHKPQRTTYLPTHSLVQQTTHTHTTHHTLKHIHTTQHTTHTHTQQHLLTSIASRNLIPNLCRRLGVKTNAIALSNACCHEPCALLMWICSVASTPNMSNSSILWADL